MTRLTTATALALIWASGALAQTELTMWYHGAGNQVESEIINQIISDFNASQSDWHVTIESFPQAAYNDAVVAAALAGDLPDILDVDGPIMPNWAWAGYLQPLPIDPAKIESFLPGPKGTWNDQLYSVGLWDAAVALVTRQSTLDELGLRTPTLEEPWTLEEFMGAMEAAKASGKYDYAIDLGMSDQGEWYPYAFLPFLWSFGGDLVDVQADPQTAEGVLNGDAGLKFGEWWQGMFANGYAPGPSQDPADHASGFQEGKYAFSWNGNWLALPFLEAYDDVVFLPAPDFGNGNYIGGASWQFAVSGTTEHPEGGAAFIEFALQDKYLAQFSDGIGLIPPTTTAAAMTQNYKESGPMAVFYDLSADQARLRPVTPGYPVASKVFLKAMMDIANGADVADTLDSAVDEIDADIQANNGYAQAQ
ncbi:Sugar binding protein [Rubellimicrobium mesophilum DSM 19309]|uniref:Sugar binding protein n=1 Tax=Rubellimicrobium mesophilum DSM 19309 TaxID=442562 RepID=A0A017HIQ3_9RHOB|nr:extracellular solute-binding protein [Rubellimicrobium mesophilum]EYD74205.1 Sugar binding protein [Rubellimicrobium mesophilum DSM 19309]